MESGSAQNMPAAKKKRKKIDTNVALAALLTE